MPWVLWTTTVSFNIWHDGVCLTDGIPRPGRLQSNSSPAILNQWTDSYANPIFVQNAQNTFVVALVDSNHMTGLVAYSPQPVFNSNGTVTTVYKGRTFTTTFTTFIAVKGKPPTYAMDGITYSTTTGQPISTTTTSNIVTIP